MLSNDVALDLNLSVPDVLFWHVLTTCFLCVGFLLTPSVN